MIFIELLKVGNGNDLEFKCHKLYYITITKKPQQDDEAF